MVGYIFCAFLLKSHFFIFSLKIKSLLSCIKYGSIESQSNDNQEALMQESSYALKELEKRYFQIF